MKTFLEIVAVVGVVLAGLGFIGMASALVDWISEHRRRRRGHH